MANKQNPIVYLGLGLAAVGGGWWLYGKLTKKDGQNGYIGEAAASSNALAWAVVHAAANALVSPPVQTRIVFFIGKPPLMSAASWAAVGGTTQKAFYYVEFNFALDTPPLNFLTVMIDALTGERPLVSDSWVVGTMRLNFGL